MQDLPEGLAAEVGDLAVGRHNDNAGAEFAASADLPSLLEHQEALPILARSARFLQLEENTVEGNSARMVPSGGFTTRSQEYLHR